MGGYVTDSRNLNFGNRWMYRQLINGSVNYTGYLGRDGTSTPYVYHLSQTTNSFRSRGESSEEEFGRTLGAAAQRLRTTRFNRHSEFDNGHTFDTIKREVIVPGTQVTWRQVSDGQSGYQYLGYIVPRTLVAWHSVPHDPDKNYWGTRAIDITRPGDSPAAVAQALLELYREGLPRLFGEASLRNRAQIARGAGEEYLNKEFGWDPLVRDVRDAAGAVARSSQILRRFVEQDGVTLRRQLDFPPIHSNTLTVKENWTIQNPPGITSSSFYATLAQRTGTLTTVVDTSIYRSFSGAFTLHVPERFIAQTLAGLVQRANYLYGLELTPELLWELAPWSWLVDWFSNIGSVISNATALSSDGLVMRYGYLMTKTVKTTSITLTGIRPKFGDVPKPITMSFRTTRKERVRATPYGFGLDPGTFSDRQWAILAALGLTRGNRSLRHSD